jgi:ATP-dependent DNA helicase DinG
LIDPNVRQALGEHGSLAQANPRFVARLAQQELATAIADTIEQAGTLIAEAGTGTGKTYAYLVPALLAGGKVLIATGTRTLQDQLFERDLPQVAAALGVAVSTAVLKGRSNYVCHYHLQRNLKDGRFANRNDIIDLRRIERFAAITDSGDRAELSDVAEDAPAWSLATSTRDNCLGSECPDHGKCFVFKARQAAQQSDLVVVNHHLFCADLALRDEGVSELLPTATAVIFDEAHLLADIATQFFGESVSSRQLVEFGRESLRNGIAFAREQADWTALSAGLEQAVRELRLACGAARRIDQPGLRDDAQILAAIEQCKIAVGVIGQQLDACAQRGPDLARGALRAAEISDRMQNWLIELIAPSQAPIAAAPADGEAADRADKRVSHDDIQRVLWAEVSNFGCTLHATPLSVAGVLQRHLDKHRRAWVFLSATLSIAGSLDHFAANLGLEDATKRIWPSPFDYTRNALLYVPPLALPPSAEQFAVSLVAAAWPLLVANRGRAFILCTTLRMVERISNLLAAQLETAEPTFLLLTQGKSTRAELLSRFRTATAPILVGAASFWEGVDVPGQQLSLVIIDKLPFAPPDDPVVRARSDRLRREGKDPFRELHLPAAAMSLKQGAGRLIRSESDRGVLMVGDVRLAEKAYGRSLLKSLPAFARSRSQEQVLAFIDASALASADTSLTPNLPPALVGTG